MKTSHYNDKSIFFAEAPVQNGVIVVRALVFYEGTQTDSLGKKTEYSKARLKRIVDNSNLFLSEGGRIPLFKDHAYNQDSVIGKIAGNLTLEEITDLPSEGLDRLIGKTGIYAQVQICGEENVVKYGDGRIKTLSVGIDLDEDRIYEVSVVPFPAVAGASLFEDSAYALDMEKTLKARENVWFFFDVFQDTLSSIDNSQETNKDALKQQAITDFTKKLRETLGLPEPSNLIPLFTKDMEQQTTEKPVVDEAAIAQYEARIAQLESEQARHAELQNKVAQLERTNEVTAKFTELKDRAVALRDGGKMTPAAYKEYFGEPKAAIATYSAPVADGGKDIEAVEAIVSYLETYGAPVVTFGRTVPLEGLDPVDDQEEIDATAKRVLSKVGI